MRRLHVCRRKTFGTVHSGYQVDALAFSAVEEGSLCLEDCLSDRHGIQQCQRPSLRVSKRCMVVYPKCPLWLVCLKPRHGSPLVFTGTSDPISHPRYYVWYMPSEARRKYYGLSNLAVSGVGVSTFDILSYRDSIVVQTLWPKRGMG